MTEYMNVHSNFGVTHIMINVGWIDASKVVLKSIWRCVMHIHKFCVDVKCARILGSYSWWMPLEHLM
jgi:hypothetical protein